MKAAVIQKTGGPEVIQYIDVECPAPAPTEVLVKVGAVAVNPIDTYIRAGMVAKPPEFPYTIGCDMAGTVEQCGDQVVGFQKGDRVWCSNQGMMGRQGTFAEFVSVDQKWLYETPVNQSDEAAAASALVGITAHLGLFLHAGLQTSDVVFVNGGTGGVGSSVVQLAKAAGAYVIATVGSEEKKKQCKKLNADLVLNYHDENLDEQIQEFTNKFGGIHVWYETLAPGNLDRTVSLMQKRGRIILMAGRSARPEFPVGPFYVNDLRMIGFAMFNASPEEQRVCADAINALSEAGKWKAQIGKTFSLSEAAEAHRLQEENTSGGAGTLSGKIILVP